VTLNKSLVESLCKPFVFLLFVSTVLGAVEIKKEIFVIDLAGYFTWSKDLISASFYSY
jgi:hypothetical protein